MDIFTVLFLGAMWLVGKSSRKTESFSSSTGGPRPGIKDRQSGHFQANRVEDPDDNEDFITYEGMKKRALKGINFNPWAPENRERTERLHVYVEQQKRKSDREWREQKEKERKAKLEPDIKSVAEIHAEYKERMLKNKKGR